MNRASNRLRFPACCPRRTRIIRKLNKSFVVLFAAAVLCLVANHSAVAQVGLANVHPNLCRGSGNDQTMERYPWDNVNLFNGNLNIPVALGVRYPIAGEFGYRFALDYNSNVWDLDQPAGTITAMPLKWSNSGFGWDLSFGRLIAPIVNGTQVGQWVYVSPDGGIHPFFSTLHYDLSENDPQDSCLYTRDGTYYRMVAPSAAQRLVEAPDGTRSLFQLSNGEWKLVQISDLFNNHISFNYSTPGAWVITDSHGRTHTIFFKADPAGYYPAIVDRIVLAAFNGTTALYTFTYTTASVARPGIDNDPATAPTVNLPLLTSITHPDGSKHNFTYHSSQDQNSSGRLSSMQLPTLGKIGWTYTTYPYASMGAQTALAPVYKTNIGVGTRSLYDATGAETGKWRYTPALKSSTTGPSGTDQIWIGESVPAGAIAVGDFEGWNWVGSNPPPMSGSLAHQSNIVSGFHQHYFYGATSTLTVNAGDLLVAYVYLDPANPPSEVMLQWNDGTWEHRAYWGANQLGWGVDGTNSRRFMGPLPAAGQWVRLEVPASQVGLEGRTVNGMAFSLFNGRATWDHAGKSGQSSMEDRELASTVTTPLGDKTVYYFSVNTMANGPEWNRSDYALPFTKNEFDRPRSPTVNVALASNGATATASNTLNGSYPPAAAINGDRIGLNWNIGGVWIDGSTNWFPDSLEVSFSGSRTIDRINVFTVQDDDAHAVEPTPDTVFAQNGIQDFDVQYFTGSGWVTVPGGSVVGNNKVWRQFTFSPIATGKIRVVINRAFMSSRIVEVEAFESSLPADTRFLSKQVFDCDGAGNNCQLLRSTYTRYEQDHPPNPASPVVTNTNRREVSSRDVYHDDVESGVARFADIDRSSFDGLGHYRQTTTNGNFGSADIRTVFLNYDAATGNYPSASYVMPLPTSLWIPRLVNLQKITEGLSTQTIEFCYDRNNGFLKRTRQWSASHPTGSAGSNDVVTVFTPDTAGQLVKEQYYGGDVQLIGTQPLCGLGMPSDSYQIQHAYQYGTRSSTQAYTVAGSPFGPKQLDISIDRNTGMAAITRDVSGIATSCEYDAMGRATWLKPETGHGAWTKHDYLVATGHTWNGTREHTTTYANGGSTVLSAKMDVFAGFGDLWAEQRLMPGQVWATRLQHVNALGWKTLESEYSTDAPTYTGFLNHDPFGRPRTVRPPDGSQHDVTYEYSGDRKAVRSANIGVAYYSSTGQVIEWPRTKTQIFDRQRRLWKEITQPAGGGSDSVTINSYDAAGRLTQRTDGKGSLLEGQFYDGRGFLFMVVHPFGNNAFYQSFDARGNALKQRVALTDLTYAFDRAGRVTSVRETANPAKIWKEFTYADANAPNDWRAGKVWIAKRHNYMNNWGPAGDAIVTETFTYGGKNGRVSNYDVSLTDAIGLREQFSQSFTYTELGDVEQLSYPNSIFAGSGNVGRVRTVTNTYGADRLTAVSGTLNSQSAPWANSISYHPNGLISQVVHSNGVTDNFGKDPNGFVRVSSISTTGVQKQSWQADQNFYSGDFQYDGNRNLVRIGTKFFIPQDGQQPPKPTDPTSFTPPCQAGWTDPFGMPNAISPDASCFPVVLLYYTATDRLFKVEDRDANKKSWFFYDELGRKMTEYNVSNGSGVWLSTRDYIYRGKSLLAIEDFLNAVASPKVYHFHLGFGISGIQTDRNGFRTGPVD